MYFYTKHLSNFWHVSHTNAYFSLMLYVICYRLHCRPHYKVGRPDISKPFMFPEDCFGEPSAIVHSEEILIKHALDINT